MHLRATLTLLGALTLIYAGAPLLLVASEELDVCCSPTGGCPSGLACLRDSTCGQESQGYCVPIETIGSENADDRR